MINRKNSPEVESQNKIYDNIVKGLAVIGVAVLFAFIFWLAVNALNFLPSGLSKINSGALTLKSKLFPSEELTFTPSCTTANSGEEFEISYTYSGVRKNILFTHNCNGDIELQISLSGQSGFSTIPCNSPIYLNPNSTKTYLKAFNHSKEVKNMELILNVAQTDLEKRNIITVLPKNADEDENTEEENNINENRNQIAKNTTDNNNSEVERKSGEKEEAIYYLEPNYSTPGSFTQVDLEGKILEFGLMSKNSKEFSSATTTISGDKQAAVHFQIKNIGDKKAKKGWNFSTVIPTSSGGEKRIFTSDGQPELNPGDRIEYTINFSKVLKNEPITFTLNVDSNGEISEVTEENNIIKKEVTYYKDTQD